MIKKKEKDVTSICQSYPECAISLQSDYTVHRDNILDTIDTIVNSENQVVFLEGEEGIGKTSLLLQYSNKHKDTICLFVNSTNRWGFDPDILRFDLCNQISFILYDKELTAEQADDTFLNTNIIYLSREAKRSNKFICFIIDGLEGLPESNKNIRDRIIEMLPIGVPNFRFIISGLPTIISDIKRKGLITKSFTLSGFTYDETGKFFSDIKIDKKYLNEIYVNCKKMPGRLNTVKNIIHSGMTVEDLMLEKYEQWNDLFEIEWRKISNSELQNMILAILALDNKKHTIQEISQVLKINVQEILDNIRSLDFLCIENLSEVKFDTEAFRKFASGKLKAYNKSINEKYVEYLIEQPDSNDSLTYLPSYLEKAGKYDVLLDYLSPEHFQEMLNRSQSLSVVHQKLDLGITTSQKLNRVEELQRFCIQKSVIRELENAQIGRSEVEARMSINDFESALALAQTTIIKEDRLHLLAIICKNKKEKGLLIEQELLDQIKTLYKEIDDNMTNDKTLEIASDLIFSCPDLAIDMVEKLNGNASGENELDLTFAKLSIASLIKSENKDFKDTFDNINSKIKNPDVRDLSNSVNLLVGKYSAEQVINEVESFDNTTNKMFLLRQWTSENRHREDAAIVVEYALNLTIVTTAYSPNANLLKEIAMPLPYINNNDKCNQLIHCIDAQKSAIEKIGPTEDYVELQIILAHAEIKLNFEASSNRLIDIYLFVSEIKDLSVKTTCLAYLYASLATIDVNVALELSDKLHSLVKDDLDKFVNELLNTTADHYQVAKRIIMALAKNRFGTGYAICKKLNTKDRRDKALRTLIQSSINVKFCKIDTKFLISTLEEIYDNEIRGEVLENLLKRLKRESDYIEDAIKFTLQLINKVRVIGDPVTYCYSICNIYSILSKDKTEKYNTLINSLLEDIKRTWKSIDVGWNKVNLGYKIVTLLANVSSMAAKDFFDMTEKYKNEIVLDSNVTAQSFIWSLRLATRAFSGLIPMKLNTSNDMERLSNLIDKIPSYGERAEIWAELALRCYKNKELIQCNKIVTEHVKPLLQYIEVTDNQYWNDLLVYLSSALYCNHKLTTFETIDKLFPNQQDEAYMSICNFIITKQTFTDPYSDSRKNGYNLEFTEIIDLCEILNRMKRDSMIYAVISAISETICYKRKKYTNQQVADVINRLTSIIDYKLPDKDNIKHDGYKIISKAEIARINKVSKQQWLDIIDEAYEISNLADKSYVLCIIATLLPNKDILLSKELLNKSKDIIDQLPSIFDRISHYEIFASTAWPVDQILSRKCMQLAMKIATENSDSSNIDFFNAQRRIIDLAHRLDTNLASTLASLADDDEARLDIKENIKHQNSINELKKHMSEKSSKNIEKNNIDNDYCIASWKLLASLNSGGIEPIHANETMKYIDVVSRVPLTKAYPLLAWMIENSLQRHSQTDYAQKIIRQMFESTLLGAELSLRLAQRSMDIINRTKFYVFDNIKSNSILINPGEREKAIEYIKDWIEINALDNIKICDPFFGIEDLEILKIIKSVNQSCSVQIITSLKHQRQEQYKQPWEETYRTHWYYRISELDPPDTKIVIIGTQLSGEPPIHDRWIISKGVGLRLGTSFNSIGLSKISEISILSKSDIEQNEYALDQYLSMSKREFNGDKLQYTLFTL